MFRLHMKFLTCFLWKMDKSRSLYIAHEAFTTRPPPLSPASSGPTFSSSPCPWPYYAVSLHPRVLAFAISSTDPVSPWAPQVQANPCVIVSSTLTTPSRADATVRWVHGTAPLSLRAHDLASQACTVFLVDTHLCNQTNRIFFLPTGPCPHIHFVIIIVHWYQFCAWYL